MADKKEMLRAEQRDDSLRVALPGPSHVLTPTESELGLVVLPPAGARDAIAAMGTAQAATLLGECIGPCGVRVA